MDSSLHCILNYEFQGLGDFWDCLVYLLVLQFIHVMSQNWRAHECAGYRFVSPNTPTIYMGNFSVDKTTSTPNIAVRITTLQWIYLYYCST